MKREIIKYNLKRIGTKKNPPCTYDVYDLELIISDGTKDHITLYADVPIQGQTIDPREDERCEAWFFCERLFGKNGLIKKQGRDDNIYLGTLYKNNRGEYRATRGYFIAENYTAQQHFDVFLSKMKNQKEETQVFDIPPKPVGLNYAISDMHGMYGSYQEALNLLRPEDNLYIIGDVIDRGKYGIEILQDIIKRSENPKENPQITFLIGNHEWMLFRTINILNKCKYEYEKKYNKDLDLKKVVNLLSEFYELKDKAKKMQKLNKNNEFDNQLDKLYRKMETLKKSVKLLNFEYGDQMFLYNWIFSNKGANTMLQYLDLSEEEQIDIYKFLATSPVILPQKIAGTDYLFVHAVPETNEQLLKNGCTLEQVWDRDLIMHKLVQERDEEYPYKNALRLGYITICGHDPTPNSIVHRPKDGYIRIDAGCGHKTKDSKLALYCIERDTVRFIDEREEPKPDYSDGSDEKVAKHKKR